MTRPLPQSLELLLLPASRGAPDEAGAWGTLAARLAEAGVAVRLVETRGLDPDAGFAALEAAATPAGEGLCLVAEREGSYLALRFACAHPGLVTSLLLLHPVLGGDLGESARDALDPAYHGVPRLDVGALSAPVELLAGRHARCPDREAARHAMRALHNVSLTFLDAGDGSLLVRAKGRVLDDALRAVRRARPALDPSERRRGRVG